MPRDYTEAGNKCAIPPNLLRPSIATKAVIDVTSIFNETIYHSKSLPKHSEWQKSETIFLGPVRCGMGTTSNTAPETRRGVRKTKPGKALPSLHRKR